MNNSATVLFAEDWKTAPIKKEVPAMIIDLRDGGSRCRSEVSKTSSNTGRATHIPFSAPVLSEVRGRDGCKGTRKVHDSGVGLHNMPCQMWHARSDTPRSGRSACACIAKASWTQAALLVGTLYRLAGGPVEFCCCICSKSCCFRSEGKTIG